MTALLAAPVPTGTWTIGAPRLLAGLDRCDVLDLPGHHDVHGAMPGLDAAKLLTLLDAVRLTGRGGAGFPLAAKLRAVQGRRPRLVVNGTESEPASGKDRVLLTRSPHLVLDGALAVAAAIDAREITLAVHDPAAATMRRAIAERADARHVRVHTSQGGFVTGEARALVRGLHGGRALPPGRREHLAASGVLVSNVETLAQVAVLARLGAREFAATGTPDEPGTVLLSIGGAVARPGVAELPLGTPLGIVLRAAGAETARAVVTGGYHGTWLPVLDQLPITRTAFAAAGGSLGAGVLLVLDPATCALGELSRVTDWLAAQSAAQCGPCRFGLPALAADVRALAHGHQQAAAHAERHAALVEGRGACHHPDGAAGFVRSALLLLGDELAAHRSGGCGRPVLGRLPVGAP